MRFVSKNSNLRVILEPGLTPQPLSGFPGKPTVAVKFENGLVEVKDETLVNKMMTHPGFNSDFVAVDEELPQDPYAHLREEKEPVHIVSEIKYGHVESSSKSRASKQNPELMKLVNDLAVEQMKKMLPSLVADGVKEVLKSMQESAKTEKVEAEKEVATEEVEEAPKAKSKK